MLDWPTLNANVIAEFRANQGRVAQFGDQPVILLHTIGARTGTLRITPLVLVIDGADQLLFATSAGAPRHPTWVYNLRSNPEIEVELGTEKYPARIDELSDSERQARVDEMASKVPQFAEYVSSAAPRKIPVFCVKRL